MREVGHSDLPHPRVLREEACQWGDAVEVSRLKGERKGWERYGGRVWARRACSGACAPLRHGRPLRVCREGGGGSLLDRLDPETDPGCTEELVLVGRGRGFGGCRPSVTGPGVARRGVP